MNNTLKHRGPDGEGIFVDSTVSLGHRRLSIIDLSEKGKQPMCNENGNIWLVFNGEIYNFRELRSELEKRGHFFKSRTDGEVIIHSYEEWQFECVKKFNGMFAFAIYDSDSQLLFLARDRFGIKPLYYYAEGNSFIFSSEIKGILCHGVARTPNDGIIFDYLSFGLLQHHSETFFKGIYKLLPGHYLTYHCKNHNLSTNKWYDLSLGQVRLSEIERVEAVRNSFTESLRMHMVADVPVGSCLSGGLDSSSIVCRMRHLASEGTIKTFSAVFPGYKMDESKYVNEVAEYANLDSHTVSPGVDDFLNDLDDLITTQEEPFGGISVYAQYKVMKLAQERGVKVLMDGQGGDELFGGYTYYFGFYFYELLKRLSWYRLSKEIFWYLNYFRNILPFQMFLFLLLPKQAKSRLWGTRAEWIAPELYEQFAVTRTEDPRWSAKSLNEGILVTLAHSALPHLLIWEDKNSMRWGIESRLPFLDYRFVEMAAALPAEDKIRNGITKHIFRVAMTNSIPDRISKRRDKIGFNVPEESWLKSPKMTELIRDLIASTSFKNRIYWNHRQITKQLGEYLNNKNGTVRKTRDIWKLLNLELWLRQFFS